VNHNVQTTNVPAGGAAMVEFRTPVPGEFHFVDHAIFRATQKGALGTIRVTGDREPSIFNGADGPMAH
jgi:nitrite reductase (NO-forming)